MNRAAIGLAVAAVALCSCDAPSQLEDSCMGFGAAASPATASDRWLLGQASRYPADGTLSGQADTFHRSQRARRQAAWEVVARVLAPVPLAQTTAVAGATVPRFRTWYGSEDINRLFESLYGGLTAAARTAQSRFSDDALDAAFGLNANYLTTLPGWTPAMLASLASSFTDADGVASIGGIDRIAISPDAARHVMSSYPEILGCMANGAPPATAPSLAPTTQQLAHQSLMMGLCQTQDIGPFSVASGGSIQAAVTGQGADAGQLRVIDSDPTVVGARCTASAQTGCTVAGPGTFVVQVATLRHDLVGTVDVEYMSPTPSLVACLDGPFPITAATVAEEWRRTDLGVPLPTYDTSGATMAAHLSQSTATWGPGEGMANPSDTEAYTLSLASGAAYRLAGLHIHTREVDNWLNITLWWSPTPDTDFGSDRAASVRALGAPWTNYKMCVATDFDEQDPSATGGFDVTDPTLAAALAAVYEGQGGPSWCSNPYIDAAPGLVRSNCVGCHQHADSGVQPGDVQTNPVLYPANGRAQVRNNYPADQFWDIDAGDQLGAVLNSTVTWWATMTQ